MKTLAKNLKNLFLGILVGLPFISFASGDISIIAEDESTEMGKIKVEVPELFDLDVSIIDDKGRIIYNETLEKGSRTALVYNLTQLEDGTYTFLSKGGHQEITKIIEVDDKKVEVVEKEIKNNPIIKLEDNLIKISLLNKDLSDVGISLNDELSIYYDKVLYNKLVVNKAIDISNLQRGNYYVNLDIGDEQHNFYFDVN